jgi:DnaJ-like protein
MSFSAHDQGELTAGGFVRLAYRLGREAVTGGLDVAEAAGAAHHLYLRRGYLTSARVDGGCAPLGQILRARGDVDEEPLRRSLEHAARVRVLSGHALKARGAISEAALASALRRQAELRLERLAAIAAGTWRFDAAAAAPPAHRSGRPFALTTWARRHLEADLDGRRAEHFAARLAGTRLSLHKDLAPDLAECDDVDRRVLAALAAPRRLDEIARASGAPRQRLLGFVWFLRSVGALTAELAGLDPRLGSEAGAAADAARTRARRTLGLDDDADPAAVRDAYRRLARRLHPDMHPGSDEPTRRALAARFAAVTEAYRSLR